VSRTRSIWRATSVERLVPPDALELAEPREPTPVADGAAIGMMDALHLAEATHAGVERRHLGRPLLGSVLILTMRPSRTWALTTQRPPQLWPHVLVTTVSPGFGATRGDS